jgi:hypothetical protein
MECQGDCRNGHRTALRLIGFKARRQMKCDLVEENLLLSMVRSMRRGGRDLADRSLTLAGHDVRGLESKP